MTYAEERDRVYNMGFREGKLIGLLKCGSIMLRRKQMTYAEMAEILEMNEVEFRAWFQLGFDDLLP